MLFIMTLLVSLPVMQMSSFNPLAAGASSVHKNVSIQQKMCKLCDPRLAAESENVINFKNNV